jgi:hypothetical protein
MPPKSLFGIPALFAEIFPEVAALVSEDGTRLKRSNTATP